MIFVGQMTAVPKFGGAVRSVNKFAGTLLNELVRDDGTLIPYLYANDDGEGNVNVFALNIDSDYVGGGRVYISAVAMTSVHDNEGNVRLCLSYEGKPPLPTL